MDQSPAVIAVVSITGLVIFLGFIFAVIWYLRRKKHGTQVRWSLSYLLSLHHIWPWRRAKGDHRRSHTRENWSIDGLGAYAAVKPAHKSQNSVSTRSQYSSTRSWPKTIISNPFKRKPIPVVSQRSGPNFIVDIEETRVAPPKAFFIPNESLVTQPYFTAGASYGMSSTTVARDNNGAGPVFAPLHEEESDFDNTSADYGDMNERGSLLFDNQDDVILIGTDFATLSSRNTSCRTTLTAIPLDQLTATAPRPPASTSPPPPLPPLPASIMNTPEHPYDYYHQTPISSPPIRIEELEEEEDDDLYVTLPEPGRTYSPLWEDVLRLQQGNINVPSLPTYGHIRSDSSESSLRRNRAVRRSPAIERLQLPSTTDLPLYDSRSAPPQSVGRTPPALSPDLYPPPLSNSSNTTSPPRRYSLLSPPRRLAEETEEKWVTIPSNDVYRSASPSPPYSRLREDIARVQEGGSSNGNSPRLRSIPLTHFRTVSAESFYRSATNGRAADTAQLPSTRHDRQLSESNVGSGGLGYGSERRHHIRPLPSPPTPNFGGGVAVP